jgi:hypothetical protein
VIHQLREKKLKSEENLVLAKLPKSITDFLEDGRAVNLETGLRNIRNSFLFFGCRVSSTYFEPVPVVSMVLDFVVLQWYCILEKQLYQKFFGDIE